jgi:hypothetical protein
MLNRLIKKYLRKKLTYFISAFLLLRIIQLFTSFNRFYNPFESRCGYLAEDIIRGKIAPLFDYLEYLESGGRIILSIFAIPFYISLGGSIISIKLIEILFWLSTLIIWYLFCYKFFGKNTAYLMSLFLILSPPLMIRASLTTAGAYNEIVLLNVIIIFILFNMLFYKKKYFIILFGLLSGFSFYFTPLFIITLVSCVLYWFIIDKRFFIRKFFTFFLFFIIGFSLVIWYIYKGIFEIAAEDPVLSPFFNSGIVGIIRLLYKFKEAITIHLFNSFSYDDFYFLKGEFLSAVNYFVFIISYLSIFWTNRKYIFNIFRNIFRKKIVDIPQQSLKEIFFILFPVVYFVIYTISDRNIGCGSLAIGPYRYLITLFPIMIMIVSLFLNKMIQLNKKGYFLITIIILCLVNGIGNIEYINVSNFNKDIIGKVWKYRASDYGRSRGWLVVERNLPNDVEQCIKEIRDFKSSEERFSFYQGIGANISEKFADDPDIWINAINQLGNFDKDFKDNCYKGFIRNKEDCEYLIDIVDSPSEWRRIIDKVEPEFRKYCYEALGVVVGTKNRDKKSKNTIEEHIRLINECPLHYKEYCFIGYGKGIGEVYWDDINKYNKIEKYIELEYVPYYYEGIGMALTERFSFDIKKTINAIDESINPNYISYCYKGIRNMIFSMFVFDKNRQLDLIQEMEKLFQKGSP